MLITSISIYFPSSELCLALPSLMGKTSFLIRPDGARIGLEHPEVNTVQVKGIKAMLAQQANRFSAISLDSSSSCHRS